MRRLGNSTWIGSVIFEAFSLFDKSALDAHRAWLNRSAVRLRVDGVFRGVLLHHEVYR